MIYALVFGIPTVLLAKKARSVKRSIAAEAAKSASQMEIWQGQVEKRYKK